MHWRVLLLLVACLNEEDRRELMETYPISTAWMEEEGLPALSTGIFT
ncbi:MAG: hypothetical protein JAY75_19125 [Candidatus Thiodiazotropha taylori]|nr:hypothetical protein [Candidatus Thiodiazotropha taylori]MCW4310334.1 hypothetical protein [Candidatus Thiodiazotropha endolucinida]